MVFSGEPSVIVRVDHVLRTLYVRSNMSAFALHGCTRGILRKKILAFQRSGSILNILLRSVHKSEFVEARFLYSSFIILNNCHDTDTRSCRALHGCQRYTLGGATSIPMERVNRNVALEAKTTDANFATHHSRITAVD